MKKKIKKKDVVKYYNYLLIKKSISNSILNCVVRLN